MSACAGTSTAWAAAGSAEPMPCFTYCHKQPQDAAPQHFISHPSSPWVPVPALPWAAVLVQPVGKPAQAQSWLQAYPIKKSHYFQPTWLSQPGLRSPGLPLRRTCGWRHGRGTTGSFDLDYESKIVIQIMIGEAQLITGCVATQKPLL